MKAIIFGVTGQDGSFMAELLLSKGYEVVGVSRRVSVPNDERVRGLIGTAGLSLVSGDVTDSACVTRILSEGRPDEIYNLAAQSDVKVSFGEPAHTTAVTYGGLLNILEACRLVCPAARLYQASSSEMFGAAVSYIDTSQPGNQRIEMTTHASASHSSPAKGLLFQDEATPFLPNSPYAIAKLAAHHAVRLYREAYGIFACSGILYNHESERRGENFVTRKITKYAARLKRAILSGKAIEKLSLGNLDAYRDWGFAGDYVQAAYLMLQQPVAADYVVATGEAHTVRQFLERAFAVAGLGDPYKHVEIDGGLFRPSEVPFLCGRADKGRAALGWRPEVGFDALVERMVLADQEALRGW